MTLVPVPAVCAAPSANGRVQFMYIVCLVRGASSNREHGSSASGIVQLLYVVCRVRGRVRSACANVVVGFYVWEMSCAASNLRSL